MLSIPSPLINGTAGSLSAFMVIWQNWLNIKETKKTSASSNRRQSPIKKKFKSSFAAF
jgi:hypothetical protein